MTTTATDPTATTSTLDVSHELRIAAPPAAAFAIMRDVGRWPQLFLPIVHTERVETGPTTDRVTVWALRGPETVVSWTSERTVDEAALTIAFVNDPPPPGVAAATGRWSFTAVEDGCVARIEHTLAPAVGTDAETVRDEFAAHSARQLAELRDIAEHADEIDDLTVDFEDPLFCAGSLDKAYEILYEADKWPERLEHVHALTMTEDVPNVQFFDMATKTEDGRQHTTRSVRICLPPGKIVYKQISLPPLLSAHTGHWTFVPERDGGMLAARHTAVIKPAALSLLGEGTTVADARRYLRRVLANNSMTNLRIAKGHAESPTGSTS